MKVDCFLPAAPKDLTKVKYAVEGLVKNVKELGDVHLCVPDKTGQTDYELDGHKVVWHEDFEVFPPLQYVLPRLRFRPSWVGTQLTKMLQNATTTEDVLVWDADCILLRPLELYKDGKKKLFEQPNDRDEAGFLRFISKLSGGELCKWSDKEKGHTRFIADHALWRRPWVFEMIDRYFPSVEDFIAFTMMNTYWRRDDTGHAIFISEYECVGQYENKFHSDEVVIEHLTKKQEDKWSDYQEEESKFKDSEIEEAIKKATDEGYDVYKCQTNCPRSPKVYAQRKEASK